LEYSPLSRHERGQLWLRLGLRLIIALCGVSLVVFAGPPLLSLLLPFVLALVLAWLLNPAIRFFQSRLGGSRSIWSAALLFALFSLAGGLLFLLSYNIFRELRSLVDNWQTIWSGTLDALTLIGSWLDRLFAYLPVEVLDWLHALAAQFLEWTQALIPTVLSAAASGAGSAAMKLPSFAVAFLVFIMAGYFITADYPHLRYLAAQHMSPDTLGLLRFIKHTASTAFGGYLKAQLILSSGVFFILLAGFTLTGQSYAFLLALFLAALDFIPIIGAGTVMLPWAALSLFTRDVRSAVALLVIWGVIALFRRVSEPRVVGNQTGLSPILSLVSIYVGMRLAGVWGMILGPVVFLVVIHICRSGVFDGLSADVKLAVRDIKSILNGPV